MHGEEVLGVDVNEGTTYVARWEGNELASHPESLGYGYLSLVAHGQPVISLVSFITSRIVHSSPTRSTLSNVLYGVYPGVQLALPD